MASLTKLNQIAALAWRRDPDNAGGYVAAVDETQLPALRAKFAAAGYEVSHSIGNLHCEDEGQHYIWVSGGDTIESPTA